MAAVELVVFRAKEGVSREDMTTAALSVTPVLREMGGFISREFGATDDGQYADIVRWSSMEAAKKAADEVMQAPAFHTFFSLIDQGTVQMLHLRAA